MLPVAVYADGGVIQRNPSPIGGTWAWCHVSASGERIRTDSGVILPRHSLPEITNNLSEYVALVRSLEALPEGWSGAVYSDSQVTLARLFKGARCKGLPPVLVRQGAAATERLDWGCLSPVLLQGHPTKAELLAGIGKEGRPVSEHNVWCDLECGVRARAWRALKAECEAGEAVA